MKELNTAEEHVARYTRVLADIAATGRRLTRDEIESHRATGRQAAENGHPLRRLVLTYLAATRASWPAAPGSEDCILAAVEQTVDALGEGHERAQHFAVREEVAARREFIDDLLHGRSDLGRLAERAERFGLLLAHAHAVAVAEGPDAYTEADPVPRRVETALTSRFGDRSILLTTKDGRLICIAPGDQSEVLTHFAKQAHAATDGGRTAIGRPHPGAGGVRHSYEEALNALDLAVRLNHDAPVLYAADLLVYPVLTRDRQAMSDLVRHTLGPLHQARGGPTPHLDTLTAYFDHGCVTAATARHLSLSIRALTYRLERIHQLTGHNPANPQHRYALQTAVIGARLLNWPANRI